MRREKIDASVTRHTWFQTGAFASVVFLVLIAGCVSPLESRNGQERPFTQAPEEWNHPVKPFRIIGNVYYVGSAGISSYLIESSAGLMLLNSGTAETASQVLANIKQLGFNPHQVKILVGLHGHYDHIGGMAVIKKATGAKLFMSAADRELVESGGRNDPQCGDACSWQPVKVNRELHDGDKIRLGGAELVVHATPGHTRGTITCTMDIRQEDREYHVVFAGSVSCPDYTLVGNPRYPVIAEDFERTFKTMKSLPCDIFLTEHGWDCALTDKIKLLERGQNTNPFIDPAGYGQYLERAEARYHDLFMKQSVLSGKHASSN
jgi:metallo-beta-lactamase class B